MAFIGHGERESAAAFALLYHHLADSQLPWMVAGRNQRPMEVDMRVGPFLSDIAGLIVSSRVHQPVQGGYDRLLPRDAVVLDRRADMGEREEAGLAPDIGSSDTE